MNLLLRKCPQELLNILITQPPVKEKTEHQLELPSYSEDTIKDMLSYIDPNLNYDQWTHIGMAIHSQGYNLELWDDWSSKGTKYKKNECQKKWNGFKLKTDGISIGTLVHLAKDNGWNRKNLQPCKKSSRDFKFIQASNLINNIKPANWLIKNYIEKHTLSLMFGEPASGKSFVAIDIACCIATNKDWHGQKVNTGSVFYIAGEGFNGLSRRIKAWELLNDTSLSNAPLYISSKPAPFYNRESALEVKNTIEAIVNQEKTKPALIIIDTLARNFGGADENNAKDMSEFTNNIDELKNTWNSSVLIVHHSGHSEKNRARGSTALKGAMDQEYKVEKRSDQITLSNTKMKDSEPPESKTFELISQQFPLKDMSQTVKSAALVTSSKKQPNKKLCPTSIKALSIIEDAINRGAGKSKCISIKECKDALVVTPLSTSDKPDSIRKAVDRSLKELENKGFIKNDGINIYLLDTSDKNGQTTPI